MDQLHKLSNFLQTPHRIKHHSNMKTSSLKKKKGIIILPLLKKMWVAVDLEEWLKILEDQIEMTDYSLNKNDFAMQSHFLFIAW